jgi:hypothetical protein
MNNSFASGWLPSAHRSRSLCGVGSCWPLQGQSDNSIAQHLETNRKTVTLWRARFQQEGLDCLWEVAPGRGRKATYEPGKIEAIVDATLRTRPNGMTHWSCRLMAADQGVSKSTINNIWQSHNLKPHR